MIDMSWFKDLPIGIQNALLEGPALIPPLGHQSNFNNARNKSLGTAFCATTGSIASILILVHFYSRVAYHKRVSAEDYVSLAALGSFAGFLYLCMRVVRSTGLLVHQWNIKLKEMPDLLYNVSAGSTVYGIVIMMLKAGILLQWVRLFVPRGTRNIFWWYCHITLWTNVLFYTICTFIEIFGCKPREKFWNIWVDGSCLDMPKINIVSAFVNFFSDVIILILPQRVIWTLHMSIVQKLGTGAVFAVGVIATACAGFRTKSSFDFANTKDISYTISELGMWCCAEMVAGFFVLCLPSFPKLFRSSSCIVGITARIKGRLHPSSNLPRDNHTASWPQFRNKVNPDASLFADKTSEDFILSTNTTMRSIFDGQEGMKPSINNDTDISAQGFKTFRF
ncbi:hypothetical protein BS50DRAFT_310126 [Corynespora cassiicola Philippines]|uniref:Rhodopsin domain-containing protein n=1 Tax=Corynespora cassiicola Philippines TaxID=1448308 RepID=A0A2T2NY13_CORCC|nr:hypothetical protein BS50DRAFT_310126 [Corynespora cassiicola Philippines]